MRLTSVRVRLALWNVGAMAVCLVGFAAATFAIVQAGVSASLDRELVARAHHIADRWAQHGPPPNIPRGEDHRPPGPDAIQAVRIVGPSNKTIFPRGNPPAWDAQAVSRARQGGPILSTITRNGEPYRVCSMPLRYEGQLSAVLQIGEPLAELQRLLSELTNTVLTLIPLALLIAGVGGMFLTDRALRPVRRVREAAQAIGAQDLSRRLPVSGRDEFSDLATTFNAMIARLEQAFDQQKRLVADTSHELRTPLTTIKGTTSLALSGKRSVIELQHALEAIDRAADLMSRTVQDLLLLARSDSGEIEVAREPVSIAEVLADAVDAVQGREGPTVDLALPEDPPDVQGDLHSLVRVFANLLDNAMRHTPDGGTITVSTRCVLDTVICSVRDTGIGIAPEHLPHLGERFYRVDKARDRSRGGTGLGLAICRSILSAHGGHLTIESKEGTGTTVTVTLPGVMPAAHAPRNDKGPGAAPQDPVSTRRS